MSNFNKINLIFSEKNSMSLPNNNLEVKNNDNENNNEESNFYPGLFFKKCILPKFFHKIIFALILLCGAAIGQGMIVTGQLIITIPMLEKNFGYTSVQTGLIHSFYDIFFAISAILIGLFGKKRKMYVIGIGALFMAIGCFCFTIPNFIVNFSSNNQAILNLTNTNEYEICKINNVPNIKKCQSIAKILHLIIFCASYSLIGNNLNNYNLIKDLVQLLFIH